MERTSHVVALAGALSIASAAMAGPADVCRDMVVSARSLPAVGAGGDPYQVLPERIAAATGGRLVMAQGVGGQGDTSVGARLRALGMPREHIDPNALASLSSADLYRLGSTRIFMLQTDEGTLHCQDYWWVEGAGEGRARALPEPQNADGLCYNEQGYGAVYRGDPVFIADNWALPEGDHLLTVSTWSGGAWSPPCRLGVRHEPILSLERVECRGSLCGRIEDIALSLAASYRLADNPASETGPTGFRWGTAPPAADAARAEEAARLVELNSPLPLIGPPHAAFAALTAPLTTFALVIDGHTYLAVIGREHLGWRILFGFLIAIYDPTDRGLIPVAAAIVGQTDGPVVWAEVLAEGGGLPQPLLAPTLRRSPASRLR